MTQPDSLTATIEQIHVPRVALDFNPFSPRDAEHITGMKMQHVRDLRRDGIIGHSDGIVRYDVFGLTFLRSIRAFAPRGGPTRAKSIAQVAAYAIGWHVLRFIDAYEGDHKKVLSWDREAFARIEAWQADTAYLYKPDLTHAEAEEEIARLSTGDGFSGWRLQATWLRAEIMRRRKFNLQPERYLIWWPNETYAFAASVDAAFNDGLAADPRFDGAVVVLDLEALAMQIMDRVDRPFVRVGIGS